MGRFLILLLLAAGIAYLVPAPVVGRQAGIEIESDREHVWEVLSDLSQMSRWNDSIDSTVFLTEQHQGKGTSIRLDGKLMTSSLTVTRWMPYGEIAFAVELKPRFTREHELSYTIQPRSEGTAVRVEERYRMAGGYLGYVFDLLIFSHTRDPYLGSALHYLKRFCETGAGLGV